MKVTVYHREGLENNIFARVAEVEAPTKDVEEALEYAYRWTQNIEGSWSRKDLENNRDANSDVEFVGEYTKSKDGKILGARSTMAFDVMYTNGSKFEVKPFSGFKKVA